MIQTFPEFRACTLGEAPRGSLVWIQRDKGWLGLAVGDPERSERGLAILSGTNWQPLPVYFQDWRTDENCLVFKTPVHWDLSLKPDDIHPTGADWWRSIGVVVVIDDRLFLRCGIDRAFGSSRVLIDVLSGTVLEKNPPSELWSFATWKLSVRDTTRDQTFPLLDYRVELPPT